MSVLQMALAAFSLLSYISVLTQSIGLRHSSRTTRERPISGITGEFPKVKIVVLEKNVFMFSSPISSITFALVTTVYVFLRFVLVEVQSLVNVN